MTWAYLDDGFPEHPKIVAAGGDAAWLYVAGLCYVQRHLTAGVIPAAIVSRLTDRQSVQRLSDRLVEVGLWERHPDGFAIHDYAEANRSAMKAKAEQDGRKARRSAQAARAADARWSNHQASDEHGTEHATSMDRASPEHQGEHPPSMNGAGGEQCSIDAQPSRALGARRRADPRGPSPNPITQSRCEPPSGEHPNVPAMDQDLETPGQDQPDALLDRLCSLWPGRARMRAEAAKVLVKARLVFDDSLIDEAVGHVLGLDVKPRQPAYLLAVLRDWATQRGIYPAGDVRLTALG